MTNRPICSSAGEKSRAAIFPPSMNGCGRQIYRPFLLEVPIDSACVLPRNGTTVTFKRSILPKPAMRRPERLRGHIWRASGHGRFRWSDGEPQSTCVGKCAPDGNRPGFFAFLHDLEIV